MHILCKIPVLLFLMGRETESLRLIWDENVSFNEAFPSRNDDYPEMLPEDEEAGFANHAVLEEDWKDNSNDDKETVILEPGETASFSFTFRDRQTSKYIEYKISEDSSPASSIVFSCDLKSHKNSLDCSDGQVLIGYKHINLRLCSRTYSLKNRQAGTFLKIKAENTLSSFNGNLQCKILATTCGKRNVERIVGGTEALPHEYPWQVGFLFPNYLPFCGGSIISNRHILTAAHCFYNKHDYSKIRAVVGMHDFRKISYTAKYLKIDKIILHEQYNNQTAANDIAIIKVADSIPFDVDNTISPICLPSNSLYSYDNVKATVCGWGMTIGDMDYSSSPVLLKVGMTTVTVEECKKKFTYPELISDKMICTVSNNQAPGISCRGDSGGPLMYQQKTFTEQIGIVSFGIKGCSPSYPDVYVRLTSYLDWIRTHMDLA
ncbi:chymotrypsin B-like [Palaemon carinicauda]|uniref:chymotrypsin B-like n=1 Tax=Palaemon carinicauda TaxID=392227 RepID=UPI0035B5D816